jgi:hypothetical protein
MWMISFVIAVGLHLLVVEPLRVVLMRACGGCLTKLLKKPPVDEDEPVNAEE